MNWERVSFPVLNEAQFSQWQRLLEMRTGIYIASEHRSLLQSNLKIRIREVGCSNYDQYYARVEAIPAGLVEWNTLLDRLTVQETRFYRDPESLELFQQYLTQRLQSRSSKRPINIWSVGCCTGEEAYTLGLLVNEIFLKQGKVAHFGITANDISLPALSKAREGLYNARKLIDLREDLILRYFEQQSRTSFKVRDEIKQKVCFSMENIAAIEKSPLRNMDVIYCQNVLIYFRKELKHSILDSLVERLIPGGMLVIGQGEATGWQHPLALRVKDSRALAFIRRESD